MRKTVRHPIIYNILTTSDFTDTKIGNKNLYMMEKDPNQVLGEKNPSNEWPLLFTSRSFSSSTQLARGGCVLSV